MTDHSSGLQIRSLIKPEGLLELSLMSVETPPPGPDEVVVRMEAAPLNPSVRRRPGRTKIDSAS